MYKRQHEDFVLINVLSPADFRDRHIRTSVNVPVADEGFVETVERISGSKQRKLVVYCASSDCDASPKAARKLEEAGFEDVYDYEGGSADWFDRAA